MSIIRSPNLGQVLMCDFTQGFSIPEMVKRRPVVVVAPPMAGRAGLVTVAACSTRAPDVQRPFHMLLPKKILPQIGLFQANDTWLKGDMIYAVGFHRLDLVRLNKNGPDGKRLYFLQSFNADLMAEVHRCVLAGIGLPQLVQHL